MTDVRVVLAEDHAVVRAGVRALLDAVHCPDVLVLDVTLPGLNGVEVAERVRREWPAVRVVALAVHEDRGYVQRMLAAGASGYVLKRSAAAELVRAVRAVSGGGTYLDPAVAGAVAGTPPADTPGTGAALSEREEECVKLIARGYSNKEIAARLKLSVKTVETYKSRSLEKLGLYSRVDLVRYAVQRGWLGEG